MMAGVPRRVVAVLGALVVAAGSAPLAGAHVEAAPSFLPATSSTSIDFVGPNERDDPMTAFRLTAPAGLVIEHAHDVDGWTASFAASTAEWTGGSLEADAEESFGVTLRADAEPGALELTAEQIYADGAVVSWPVDVTVTPADASPSQNLAVAGLVALIGLLLVVAVSVIAWRRRGAEH